MRSWAALFRPVGEKQMSMYHNLWFKILLFIYLKYFIKYIIVEMMVID